MLPLALVVVLAASPVKLAAPGFTTVGVEPQLGAVYLDRLTSLLTRLGPITITTAADLQQVVGLERQRALLGCEQNTSCLAELVGALGVDAILGGSLARTGSGFLVTLRVLKSSSGADVVTVSARLADEAQLGQWLETEAPELARKILIAFGRPGDAALIQSAPTTSPAVRWVPAIAGAALAIGGGVCLLLASESATKLEDPGISLSAEKIRSTADVGRTTQVLGPILLGTGAAAIASSVIWALAAGRGPAVVAIVPGPQGVSVAVGGRF